MHFHYTFVYCREMQIIHSLQHNKHHLEMYFLFLFDCLQSFVTNLMKADKLNHI